MDAGGRDDAPEVSPGLAEVVGRALTDASFRETLFTDRQAAVTDLRLSQADQEALDTIPREVLEEHAARFAEGSAVAIEVGIVIKGTF